MSGFLLKTKIDTSLENAFRDQNIHPTIGEVFSNGAKLIFSVTCVIHQRPRKGSRCNNMYTSLEYAFIDLLAKFGHVNFVYSPPSQTRFSPIQNNRHTWLESPFSCDTLWIWRFCILQNKNTWWVQLLWSHLKTLKASWNHTLMVTLFTLVSLGWKYL
jgi:hypothetical protein